MDELRGLSGGKKQMWLNQNRETILGHMAEHGAEATMREFHISRATWESFLVRPVRKVEGLAKTDRALIMAESAIDTARESSRRCTQLESRLEALMPVVQVVYALSAVLKMVGSLPALSDDFERKSQNRG